jgi:hypothetical protein
MKKILRITLLFVLTFNILNCSTNKTFDLPRPHGVNLAMEYSTWNELLQTKCDDRFGTNLQVVPFYQDSDNKKHMGKYFGIKNKHTFKIGYSQDPETQDSYQVNSRYIFHDYSSPTARKAEIKYRPTQKAYGTRIDLHQNLSTFINGLYLKAAFPIVHVKNDMNLDIDQIEGFSDNDVKNFYKGTFTGFNDSTNVQAALKHSKIYKEKSITQLADVDVILGCKFLDREKYHIALNLGATIPTGNKAAGDWVFEPISGNGNHWAFGGGADLSVNLWSKKNQIIKLEGLLNYRYLFNNEERRTLRLRKDHEYPYSQYYLLVKKNSPAGTPLIPAANVLTKRLDVDPGSQIDTIITLVYKLNGLRLEIGYNFFMKNDEDIHLDSWPNDKYGIAKLDLNVKTLASSGQAAHDYVDLSKDAIKIIKKKNLDTGAAESPEQDTHKIYAGLGYVSQDLKFPIMIGIGGHYEIAYDHIGGIQNWGIWGKMGFGF